MPHEGTNWLARVIDERIGSRGGKKRPIADYGTIRDDMSLVTNGFPVPIPQSDYVILDLAKDRIRPGVRVFVMWAGDDAVVIDTIGALNTPPG